MDALRLVAEQCESAWDELMPWSEMWKSAVSKCGLNVELDIPGEEADNSRRDEREDNGAGDVEAEDDGVEPDAPMYVGIDIGDDSPDGASPTADGEWVL